jgi:hypothetical protein
MNVAIFIIYVIRVVPDIVDSFYSVIGAKDDTGSRMNALRRVPWLQGDDNAYMQLGYKLDRYMNSVYIAVTNLLMLCRSLFAPLPSLPYRLTIDNVQSYYS